MSGERFTGVRRRPARDRDAAPTKDGDRPRSPIRREGGRRQTRPERGPRPPAAPKKEDPEKTARREKAQVIAQEKGIPLSHAHRIVQGRATLNEVLKSLMRKERFDRLVRHDGLDPSLAGQVASGHLSKARALQLTQIRKHRKQRLDHDAIKLAERSKLPIALNIFGRGWLTGVVSNARVYDFDLTMGEDEPETVFKHDVKAVADPSAVVDVATATRVDKKIKTKGLAGTKERADRVRPNDADLLDAVETGRTIDWLLRDGDTIPGRIISFGRWDVEVVVGEADARVQILFHSLHPNVKIAR